MEKRFRARDLTFMALFAALMAVGANVAQFLVIGGIPITLQTFFAILAGAILGSRLGSLSMILYLCIGLVGAPVFSQFTGGPAIFFRPTFGFVLSFIVLAYVVGKIIEKPYFPTTTKFFIACFTGLFLNYFIGTNYMYFAFKFWLDAPEGFSYTAAWMMMVPPLPKDIILTIFAAIAAPRIQRALNFSKQTPQSL